MLLITFLLLTSYYYEPPVYSEPRATKPPVYPYPDPNQCLWDTWELPGQQDCYYS